jgi:hypothetical protein
VFYPDGCPGSSCSEASRVPPNLAPKCSLTSTCSQTRSHRSLSGAGTAKGGEGVQCAGNWAKRGRRAADVERREVDGDGNMQERGLSSLAPCFTAARPRAATDEVVARVH